MRVVCRCRRLASVEADGNAGALAPTPAGNAAAAASSVMDVVSRYRTGRLSYLFSEEDAVAAHDARGNPGGAPASAAGPGAEPGRRVQHGSGGVHRESERRKTHKSCWAPPQQQQLMLMMCQQFAIPHRSVCHPDVAQRRLDQGSQRDALRSCALRGPGGAMRGRAPRDGGLVRLRWRRGAGQRRLSDRAAARAGCAGGAAVGLRGASAGGLSTSSRGVARLGGCGGGDGGGDDVRFTAAATRVMAGSGDAVAPLSTTSSPLAAPPARSSPRRRRARVGQRLAARCRGIRTAVEGAVAGVAEGAQPPSR
jgi:hypothetical protein